MPREMNPDNDATHRVVIITPRHWRNPGEPVDGEYTWTRCYGPYSRLGTARGILKKELADAKRHRLNPNEVQGWIERSATEWRRVVE